MPEPEGEDLFSLLRLRLEFEHGNGLREVVLASRQKPPWLAGAPAGSTTRQPPERRQRPKASGAASGARPEAPAASRENLAPAASSVSSAVQFDLFSGVSREAATLAEDDDRPQRLAALEKRCLTCSQCPHLVQTRTQVVFGVGNPRAELMFVGEAPGVEEDAQGIPFVGRAGQLLTKMIEAIGYTRPQVYIANVLKCRPDHPPPGNRPPSPEELRHCTPWLEEQLEIIHPRAIVALGAPAAQFLLDTKRGITSLRGKWGWFRHFPVMPTFHSAYLLRAYTRQNRQLVWDDLQKARDFVRSGREEP